MKTFSTSMEICRNRSSHDVAWLAELEWDDATGRYSSRAVTIGGVAYEPIIAAVDRLQLSMQPITGNGAPNVAPVRLELINTPEQGGQRFASRVNDQPLEGRTVRIGFVFLDPLVSLQPSDVIWLQTYRIERVDLGSTRAVLYLLESPVAEGRKTIGRRLVPSIDPHLSDEAIGHVIPVIFGRIERAPLVPFRAGRRGRLRETLDAGDSVVIAEEVSYFPESGRVQVGGEIIAYSSVDRSAHTLGTSDTPVTRMTPARHQAGEAVNWIPGGGLEYLVADHLCLSVGPVYSGDRRIDAAAYQVKTEMVAGREVQKVVFPNYPVEVEYGASLNVRRIDGREDENLWAPAQANNAEDALASVVGSDPVSAAVLNAEKTPLAIEYLGNLSAGSSMYGELVRCSLVLDYSASRRWSVTNDIEVIVGRGAASASFLLGRPPVSESLVTLPAHSHADTIRDEVADTRGLFSIDEQALLVDFDRVQATGGWSNNALAIDGNLDTWCENSPAGGPLETAPLKARLLRDPLASESVDLLAVEFQARLATDEPALVPAALDVAVAGKFVDSRFVEVGGSAETFEYSLELSGLTVDDLVDPATAFAVRSVDGRQLKVYGLWLKVRYRPKITGRRESVSQTRRGVVAASAPVPVSLPTARYRQAFDITGFIEANGGWRFFSEESGDRPYVRVDFGSASDTATVRVTSLGFEVKYRERSAVTVFDRFDATVEGVSLLGEAIENPADIIEWLATDQAGLGWDSGTIDDASFAAARSRFEAEDWKLSRRIGEPRPVDALLNEIALESGCRLVWEAGQLRLLPLRPVLLASDAVATLGESLILAAPLVRQGSELAGLAGAVRIRYGEDGAHWVDLTDPGSADFAPGALEREFTARWHASSSPSRATRLAGVLLSQWAHPTRLVKIDLPISQSHLERGDVVVVDHAASNLQQAVGEVVGVEFAEGRRVRVTVAIAPIAMYCWYADADTFISHLPGHAEKVFVLEGNLVAALDRTGRFRLGGEVVEEGLQPHAMSTAIEHDAGAQRLYFGVGSAGTGYDAVFALDVAGRLLLRGSARENADLSSIAMSGCYEATASSFRFSCDLTSALIQYDASADRMDLAGEFVEGALMY